MTAELVVKFRYKAWSNSELMESIAAIDHDRYPSQQNLALRLLNHTYVVDRIFAATLTGAGHEFTATNTTETPDLAHLGPAITNSDKWYSRYVKGIPSRLLRTIVRFQFTDGDLGAMTREEMLFHVLVHGAYHRGNIGMLLTDCGVDRPKDTFTRFLHFEEPARRRPEQGTGSEFRGYRQVDDPEC